MARLNNDAREILCNMVTEKAETKRKQLTDKLTALLGLCSGHIGDSTETKYTILKVSCYAATL